ncbi:Coenzyme F420 hydrogenase/dehydrogenase, beta subunit C-terminal domain [Sphingomonas endophytica]|uniref:Coenzyme F420-reducing hydrogenase beta subunit n=1 Tax=Sphingomonas endophytica TaxID=869719 RepID=A0ABR6N6P3_9SPHN|nr:Coenzyme F420 hydrogenase/dehydrogenase, beta subunit C-terminal domain [Sphingomonas endophytica]MBB5726189.1 coenzyme F420-reducing hydrogenase beta subunit [Sphingomonas endophytica]
MAEALRPDDIVGAGLCIGCGGCAAAMRMDRDGLWKPEPGTPGGADFPARCPFSPDAANEDVLAAERFPAAPAHSELLGRFESTWVGHVAEGDVRANGSSGGMVSWVAAELLRTGAVDAVAHVAPVADPGADGRFFRYRLSRDGEEIAGGAKSRYYPVELSAVIAAIRATPGRYAVVAVPCFIKALNLLRRTDPVIAERVTHLLGLFCGHQKSARLVDSFAWQLDTPIARVRAVDYRIKDATRPANWYRAHLTLDDGSARAEDWWHLADGDWGAGFFQNPACDWCDDVVAETADVAFGDAWVEPYSLDGRGTNVVIARSPAVHAMIAGAVADGRLALTEVDAAFVEQTQAAGFRHRREGLAYRLTWRRGGDALRPVKRVAPSAALPARRKLVYRMRHMIARDSHRIARAALRSGRPWLYTAWARKVLAVYRAVAWSHGRLGAWVDRVLPERRAR